MTADTHSEIWKSKKMRTNFYTLASSVTGVCRSGGGGANQLLEPSMIICTCLCLWCFPLCPLGDAVRLRPRIRTRDQAAGQIQGPRWNR